MPTLAQLFDRNVANRKEAEAAKAAKLRRKREAAARAERARVEKLWGIGGTLAERFAREVESSCELGDLNIMMYEDALDLLEDYRYLDPDELEELEEIMEFGLWRR